MTARIINLAAHRRARRAARPDRELAPFNALLFAGAFGCACLYIGVAVWVDHIVRLSK